jgi:DNA-directed RNA polymerase subunit omega
VIKPLLEALLDRVGNKYALVIVAAKRARQIKEGALSMVDLDTGNPVTAALEEIAAGKIRYEMPKLGIKHSASLPHG